MNEDTLSAAWKKLIEQADSAGVDPAHTWKTAIPQMESTKTEIGPAKADVTVVAKARGSDQDHTNIGPSLTIARNQGDLTIRAGAGKQSLALPVIPEKSLELLEEIGRGGMGAVYRAKQSQLRRIVAVKTSHITPKGDMDFLSEAFITAHLDHPNIAPVHDLAISDDNELRLVMKLVSGKSWRDRLAADTCVGDLLSSDLFDEHLLILQQVCQAVGFAHSRGILHCDLKPDNVMLGDFGEVLLMDWGVALDFRDPEAITVEDARAVHRSAVSSPRGTPVYMPAELSLGAGESLGPWTDTYLCGAILYELITGRPPHIGKTMAEVLHKSLGGKRNDLPSGTPEELRRIVDKALHSDVKQRYQSAAELRSALIEFRKHRESHWIAEAGRQTLADCKKVIDNSARLDSRSRNELYADFAESVASFRQAQQLWSDNSLAKNGEFEARRSLAQFALTNGDLALAEAHISRFSDNHPDRSRLQSELKNALALELQEERNKARLKVGLIGSIAAIVLGAVTFAFVVQGKVEELRIEKNKALSAEKSALAAKEVAQKQSRKTYEAYRSLVVEVNDNLQGILGQGVYDARLKLSKMALEGLSAGRKDGTLQNFGETKNVSAEACLNIAQIHANLMQDNDAHQSLKKVFSILEGVKDNSEADRIRALAHKTRATMAMANKNLMEARKHALKGWDIVQKQKNEGKDRKLNSQVTSPLLLLLGRISLELGETATAAAYYEKLSLKSGELNLGQSSPIENTLYAQSQTQLGICLRLLSKPDKAEPLLQKARQIYYRLMEKRFLFRDQYHGLIETLCSLSGIHEGRGENKKGLECTSEAMNILENLLTIDDRNKKTQEIACFAISSHAFSLQHNGQLLEAIQANTRGLKFARRFVNNGNRSKKMRNFLASFPMQLARNLVDLKRYEKVLPLLTEAISVLEKLIKEDPNNSQNMENIVLAYNDRAHVYQKTNQDLKANADFQHASESLHKLAGLKKMTARRFRIAIMVGSNTARFYNKTGKHQDALKVCQRSVQFATDLTKMEPKNTHSRRMLSVVLYDAGTTCLQLNEYKEAAEFFERAAKNHEHLLKAQPELKREQQIFQRRAAQMREKAKQ